MAAASRRIRAFRVSVLAIETILKGFGLPAENLPPDAKVVRFYMQWETDSPVIIVESEMFVPVTESDTIPIEELFLKVRHDR